MNSYIVRIYRQEHNKPGKLVGIVEEVGVEGTRGFTDLDELWEILNHRSRREKSPSQPEKLHAHQRRKRHEEIA